ncbi:disulfide oxidoreductase [Bacillus spongiae]|uniref:disulfide oxidoreductase n=1 Tax=Bacillus spongiae TaxID=2683610 RepID=UPI003AF768F8
MSKSQLFMYAAWLVSMIATLGSLYFSEIKGFIPCELCWYQRILMYPLTLILGIGTFQHDLNVRKIVFPMAIIGWCISLFHYLEQKVPGFAEIKPCANGVPCSAEYINWFGFITIPFLALTGFTFILIFTLLARKEK